MLEARFPQNITKFSPRKIHRGAVNTPVFVLPSAPRMIRSDKPGHYPSMMRLGRHRDKQLQNRRLTVYRHRPERQNEILDQTKEVVLEMKTNSIILFLMFLTAAVVFTPASYAQGTCT